MSVDYLPETIRAADLLVRQLQLNGVDRVFCVPGESYLAVLDAMVDAPDIQVVTCRHEGAAAMMGDAYGRLTGRPGIVFVTRGPGATNASSGIHVAHQDGTPLIVFVGDIDRSTVGRDTFQEIDYPAMFAPITKFVAQIADPARIPELVGRAFHTAMSGRPGPVLLSLHEDMLLDQVAASPARRIERVASTPSAADLSDLQRRLVDAERPVLILGGGGWSADAALDIQNFAEAWRIPVASSFRCQDYVDNASDCYVGNLGLGADPKLRKALDRSDLVVLLGGRLGEVTSDGYTMLSLPVPQLDLIHVHADVEELGRVYQPVMSINAGSPEMAQALAGLSPPDSAPRTDWASALRSGYLAWTAPVTIPDAVQMGQIMSWLSQTLPDDAIIANGAGNFAIWPNRFHRYRRYGTMLAPRSGSMGYGVPAAIAAKLQHPERQVVCFAGDGDFLMTGQELATARKYNAAIVVIVINNGMYGTIRMHQERDFPERVSATELVNPDFVMLAKSYGAWAERVEATEEFAPAYRRAIESGTMALIEIVMDPEAISPSATITSLREAGRHS